MQTDNDKSFLMLFTLQIVYFGNLVSKRGHYRRSVVLHLLEPEKARESNLSCTFWVLRT